MVHAQASLLSYIDVFFAFAVAAFCMVLVALLLLRPIALGAGQRRTPVHDVPNEEPAPSKPRPSGDGRPLFGRCGPRPWLSDSYGRQNEF
jgi:hypothetical protein